MSLEKPWFNTCVFVFVQRLSYRYIFKGYVTTLWFQSTLINSLLSNTSTVKDFCKLDFYTFPKAVCETTLLVYIEFKDETSGVLPHVSNLKKLNAHFQMLVATVTEN